MEKVQNYVIAAIVEHKPGVLYEVANMFRRRSFNIDSISVGATEHNDLARMTITVSGDEYTIEQIIKQMNKLINVKHNMDAGIAAATVSEEYHVRNMRSTKC